MQIGIAQIIAGLIAVAVLIGGAFAVGTKWNGGTDGSAETAAAVSALESSGASTTDEEILAPTGAPLYKVLRIVDGDTIAVEIDGKSQTVRLIGIDTPEINDSRTGVQCFGKEAAAWATELASGKKVRLEKDATQGERDKYKRLLAYVFREDGLFLNRAMIAEGYGHEYTYDTPYKYQRQFKAAEVEAREGEKGLWSSEACPTPAPKRPSKSESSSTIKTSNAGQAAAAAAAAAPPPAQQPVQQSIQMTPVPQPQTESPPVTSNPQPVTSSPPPPPPVTNNQQPVTRSPPPATNSQPSVTTSPPPPAPPSIDTSNIVCSTNTYNCSDFKTQKEAQKVYDQCGGLAKDVHRLDNNKDGSACDSLP